MSSKHGRKKDRHIFLIIFKIISIIIIIACSIYIVGWYFENRRNAKMLSELTESTIIDTVSIQIPESVNEGEQPTVVEIITYELDFPKLFATNSRTVGWISVPNTCINYPVAQHSDNSFYLNHSFDKSYNTAGWIFADYRNKFDGTDKNIIIYGHNRMDSSMFATLKNTQKADWYNNTTNKYVTYTTPEGVHVYQVFSVYTIKSETYYLATEFSSDESYLKFLNTLKSRSVHDFGTELTAEDKILTLSTCDATGKSRVILHAKQIM